jgi:signal peptidase I
VDVGGNVGFAQLRSRLFIQTRNRRGSASAGPGGACQYYLREWEAVLNQKQQFRFIDWKITDWEVLRAAGQAQKYSYAPTSAAVPKRGDIVVFEWPERPSQVLVKRVIGLPGDLVEIREGVVYINGDRLPEPYVQSPVSGNFPPVTVPSGAVWVMGDNRAKSFDSRMFGDVQLGKVRAIASGTRR